MKNSSYWEKRRAQETYEHMLEAEKAAEEVKKLYIQASEDLQERAKKVFDKFQKENHLTRKEAEKLLKEIKDPSDIKEIKRALKRNPKNEELVREWESQAYASRLRNFSAIHTQLDTLLPALATTQELSFRRILESIAETAFYQTIFDLQQYSGSAFPFTKLDPRKIARVLNMKWAGSNFSSRIWDNKDLLAARVKRDLALNLLTGRPLKKAADDIAADFTGGYNAARRLIRTESTFVAGQLSKLGYEETNVKKYIYVAILDLRTSLICQSLDKKVFLVKNAKEGENYPPMHPWCRSTTLPWVPNDLLQRMRQSAIDPATGKRITVPGNMTYREWYAKYVDGRQSEKSVELVKVKDTELGEENIPEDINQEITDVIAKLDKEYNLKTSIEYQELDDSGAPMRFVPTIDAAGNYKGKIVVNTGFTWEKSLDKMNARILKKNYDKGILTSKNVEDLVLHEYAHILTFKRCKTKADFDRANMEYLRKWHQLPPEARNISIYAQKSQDGSEVIAEAFVALRRGEALHPMLKLEVDNIIF